MNIIISGVGGQGTILASKLISQCALKEGLEVKTSEVFGMAQRGGSVNSEIRLGKEIVSPMISEKEVDLLISFELIETARNINKLSNEGKVLTNDTLIRSFSTSSEKVEKEDVIDVLNEKTDSLMVMPGTKLSKDVGNTKVLNIILIGTALGLELLPFSLDTVKEVLNEMLPKKIVEVNLQALDAGIKYVETLKKFEQLATS